MNSRKYEPTGVLQNLIYNGTFTGFQHRVTYTSKSSTPKIKTFEIVRNEAMYFITVNFTSKEQRDAFSHNCFQNIPNFTNPSPIRIGNAPEPPANEFFKPFIDCRDFSNWTLIHCIFEEINRFDLLDTETKNEIGHIFGFNFEDEFLEHVDRGHFDEALAEAIKNKDDKLIWKICERQALNNEADKSKIVKAFLNIHKSNARYSDAKANILAALKSLSLTTAIALVQKADDDDLLWELCTYYQKTFPNRYEEILDAYQAIPEKSQYYHMAHERILEVLQTFDTNDLSTKDKEEFLQNKFRAAVFSGDDYQILAKHIYLELCGYQMNGPGYILPQGKLTDVEAHIGAAKVIKNQNKELEQLRQELALIKSQTNNSANMSTENNASSARMFTRAPRLESDSTTPRLESDSTKTRDNKRARKS